jgi:hypothetical protein
MNGYGKLVHITRAYSEVSDYPLQATTISVYSHTEDLIPYNALIFVYCVAMKSVKDKINSKGLCGLVVRAPGYRSRGPGSIPGVTRFSEK